jgi:hypothetical protein
MANRENLKKVASLLLTGGFVGLTYFFYKSMTKGGVNNQLNVVGYLISFVLAVIFCCIFMVRLFGGSVQVVPAVEPLAVPVVEPLPGWDDPPSIEPLNDEYTQRDPPSYHTNTRSLEEEQPDIASGSN